MVGQLKFQSSPCARIQIMSVLTDVLSLPILGVEVSNGDKLVEHKTFFKPNRYSDSKEDQCGESVWFLLCLLTVAIVLQGSE